jgi:hypothetical protein
MTKKGLLFKLILSSVLLATIANLGVTWIDKHGSWSVKLRYKQFIDADVLPEWAYFPIIVLLLFMRILYEIFGGPFVLVGEWLLDLKPTTTIQSLAFDVISLISLYKILC